MSFHEGERRVQHRAGVETNAARIGQGIRPEIPPMAAVFLAAQPWLVLGAADRAGRFWATLLQGPPGFARAHDERTVIVDALLDAGDPLDGELDGGREVGLLAIDLAHRKRMRVNGRVVSLRPLTLTTDQVYSNCPKYIQARPFAGEAAHRQPGAVVRADRLRPDDRAHIEGADTFFIASGVAGEGADASHRGGERGFVDVVGNRLSWPDYAGNTMFNTLGNLVRNPSAGLLFVDFARGDLLHLTGRAAIDWSAERAGEVRGAERMIDFEVDAVVHRPGALALAFDDADASRAP